MVHAVKLACGVIVSNVVVAHIVKLGHVVNAANVVIVANVVGILLASVVVIFLHAAEVAVKINHFVV